MCETPRRHFWSQKSFFRIKATNTHSWGQNWPCIWFLFFGGRGGGGKTRKGNSKVGAVRPHFWRQNCPAVFFLPFFGDVTGTKQAILKSEFVLSFFVSFFWTKHKWETRRVNSEVGTLCLPSFCLYRTRGKAQSLHRRRQNWFFFGMKDTMRCQRPGLPLRLPTQRRASFICCHSVGCRCCCPVMSLCSLCLAVP